MNNEILKRLLATYLAETEDHVEVISKGLLALEAKTEASESYLLSEDHLLIESLYREAHSLKGATRAVGLSDLENLCAAMESFFSLLKKGEISLSKDLFDSAHTLTTKLLDYLASENDEVKRNNRSLIDEVVGHFQRQMLFHTKPQSKENIEYSINSGLAATSFTGRNFDRQEPVNISCMGQETAGNEPVVSKDNSKKTIYIQDPAATRSLGTGTARLEIKKLDNLFLQIEELLTDKQILASLQQEILEIRSLFALWKKKQKSGGINLKNIHSQLSRINIEPGNRSSELSQENILLRALEILEDQKRLLEKLDFHLQSIDKTVSRETRDFGLRVNNLLADSKDILMLPCSYLFDQFPKMVRDLSNDLGKMTTLVIKGNDFRIDRRILDGLREPLIHLFRNCIDHGIEKPDERRAKMKDPAGQIRLEVNNLEGNKLEIIVEDDGRGIDLEALRSVAQKEGKLPGENPLGEASDREFLEMIFESGISTSQTITDISGHGLGMAIVKEKLEGFGGAIRVESSKEKGAKFIMHVPVTLATFRGVVVSVSDRFFVIPSSDLIRVSRILSSMVRTIENKEIVFIDNSPAAFVHLNEVLNIPSSKQKGRFINVAVVSSTGKKIAFCVDNIIGEQEVLLKPLGKQLKRVRNISGAAILEGNRVVPVLKVRDLVKSTEKFSGPAKASNEEATVENDKSILVVDDSVTSRMLVKDILESAGYSVRTAVDGMDALEKLKTGKTDLVVSDVEMPRMDGFTLTEEIRKKSTVSDIPVILVTALSRQEDRERGIDAGASAYIVKGNFEQSNLLETIKRLL